MEDLVEQTRIELKDGATVAVIGGGPAGAFFAIHLLRQARELGRRLRVVIFERRRPSSGLDVLCVGQGWKGCNYCAGGISPKLNDLLDKLGMKLPEQIIESRVHTVTIQGFWKNIELAVPSGREMLSVFRGSRPSRQFERYHNFDSFLLDQALKTGAEVHSTEVESVEREEDGRPRVRFRTGETAGHLTAELVVFATGVNEGVGAPAEKSLLFPSLQRLMPGFEPPELRRTLILEMETKPGVPGSLAGTVHFVEYGSRAVRVEMCSVLPKRGFVTIVLVGESVDRATTPGECREVMRQFLALPHIQRLVSPAVEFRPVCVCSPNMVAGSARHPFGNRAAAVGDIVTARLYKDGILSAHQTARALAEAVLQVGIDAGSLERGYGPSLEHFRRDNRYARLVFVLHRVFFSSSVLSRILYQAVIDERKTTPSPRRHLEKILWRIASGDDDYRAIFLSMIHPATVWSILGDGALITWRNYLTELVFGLRWGEFGRYTTGVALERLEDKRRTFARLLEAASVSVPAGLEFERMYTIKVGARREEILAQLGRFGEPDREYLRPRWVRVQRVAGVPNTPGCVIRYEILGRRLRFHLRLEQLVGGHLAVYRVEDGFARGGVLIFEIEEVAEETCAVSIYVAFNFARGRSWFTRWFWRLFRKSFPAFVHDVIWNHSLCKLKDVTELGRGG